MKRQVLHGMAAVVVGAMVFAGCTAPGGPVPSPSPSVVVTESPSASASPTPTSSLSAEALLLEQIPDAAKGDDLLAAVEMAKFFITLHPGLYQGDDPALFEFLSLPECEFCSSSVAVTQERLAEGTVQVGGEFTVPDQVEDAVLDLETDDTTTALVGFDVIEAPYEFRDAAGEVTLTDPGGPLEAAIALRYIDGIWRIYGISTRS